MELVAYPDPRLRRRCSHVPSGRELLEAASEMRTRMREWGGIGLAAPQCGLPWRMFVASVAGRDVAFVDPEVVPGSSTEEGLEGCLSIRGVAVPVLRARTAVVRATDEEGRPFRLRLSGIEARCVQHELDHLDGVLSLDRVEGWVRRAAIDALWRARRGL